MAYSFLWWLFVKVWIYVKPEEKVSPANSELNCAQNNNSGDTYGTGDTLHTLSFLAATTGSESYNCYYCDTFPPTPHRQEYEKHIVNKHFGKSAYPTKYELEATRNKLAEKNSNQ
jgi:hypothetical protein